MKIIEGTTANVPPQGGRKHPHQEFLQVDTTNILFICGGAFVGLDKVIENRIGEKSMGFGAKIESRQARPIGEILAQVEPQDLLKNGLIPEFVGRFPVYAALDELDEKALVRILTEPKNALVKQYRKFFEFEGVSLKFSDEALMAVAGIAQKRKTGARGLKAVLENVMLDVMYDLPSQVNVKECIISEAVVDGKEEPLLIYEQKESA